jgi:hypothetical protein
MGQERNINGESVFRCSRSKSRRQLTAFLVASNIFMRAPNAPYIVDLFLFTLFEFRGPPVDGLLVICLQVLTRALFDIARQKGGACRTSNRWPNRWEGPSSAMVLLFFHFPDVVSPRSSAFLVWCSENAQMMALRKMFLEATPKFLQYFIPIVVEVHPAAWPLTPWLKDAIDEHHAALIDV